MNNNDTRIDKAISDILKQNGISDIAQESFLNPTYNMIKDTWKKLPGVDEARDRIWKYIPVPFGGEGTLAVYPVYTFGDFDIDGITATIIMLNALKKVGIDNVGYYIPDRVIEGHGLSNLAIDKIHNRAGKPSKMLLITVDCGISDYSKVEYAKKLGMEVIVTDHHEWEEKTLPDCIIVKNDKDAIHNTEFSGAGLSFKLAQGVLYKSFEEYAEELLWLAALGTIVDCVPLFGENRVIAKLGIEQMNIHRPYCIQSILRYSNTDEHLRIGKKDITWTISPRLSSPSRFSNTLSERILMAEDRNSTDRENIESLAQEIERINIERKTAVSNCINYIKENRLVQVYYVDDNQDDALFTIVILPDSMNVKGIQGLIASKLKDEYNASSFVFVRGATNENLYGSFRGTSNCDISEIIRLAIQDAIVIEGGGHKAAGGCIIPLSQLELFKAIIYNVIRDESITGESEGFVYEIPTDLIGFDLLRKLHNDLDPFWDGDSPIFRSEFSYKGGLKLIGDDRAHLTFDVKCNLSYESYRVLGWFKAHLSEQVEKLSDDDIIKLEYRIFENEWNNVKSVQLELIKIITD